MYKVISKEKTTLSESSQDRNIKFAFCKEIGDTLEMCHQFVKCRDFLSDVWYYGKSGKKVAYFGFRYDETDPQPDTDAVKLLLYVGNREHLLVFKENQELLINTISSIGWGTPTITEIPVHINGDTYFYLKAPIQWYSTSYSLSLLTFMCRLACYRHPDGDLFSMPTNTYSQDRGYLNTINSVYKYTLRKAIQVWMKSPLLVDCGTKASVETIHDIGGVLNYFVGTSNTLNAHQLQEHIYNEMSKL